MQRRSLRPTLAAIAKHTGFAKASVGYILRGQSAAFAPETVRKVQEAAVALGYRPNAAARAMSTRRFGQIGLLLSGGPQRSIVSPELLVALAEQVGMRESTLALSVCDDARLIDPAYVPHILRDLMVDGLISAYSYQVPVGMVELLDRHHLPCVWINVKRPTDAVHPDDLGGARAATERLLHLGHHRIAYLDYEIGTNSPEIYRHYSMTDRYDGYAAAMVAVGLAPRRIAQPDRVADDQRVAACRPWLAHSSRPTAVLAYGAVSARSVLAAAAAEGLSVPDDLSLVTFGSTMVNDFALPIETMLIDDHTIAARAIELLMRRISEPTAVVPSVAVSLRLGEGRSSGRPK